MPTTTPRRATPRPTPARRDHATRRRDADLLDRLKDVQDLLDAIDPEVLADRVRRIRRREGLSIRDVAARAGISKTSLVRLEATGRVRATTVLAVCNALGVHVNRVVEPSDGELTRVAVHRRSDDRWHDLNDFGSGPLLGLDRPLTPRERRRAAERDDAIPLNMLASRFPDAGLLPSILELRGPTDARSHAGVEFVYVLEGRLRLTVGGVVHDLAEGESISFHSAEIHTYAPAPRAAKPVRVLSVRIDR